MSKFQSSFIYSKTSLDFSLDISVESFYFNASGKTLSAYSGSNIIAYRIPLSHTVLNPTDIILCFKLKDGSTYPLHLSRAIPAIAEWYKAFSEANV